MEEMLTVEEVAKKLRRRPFTVRKLLRDRKLTGYKMGNEWFVKPEDIQQYIEAQKYQGPTSN